MDDICKGIREQLPELIGEGLPPEKAVELEQHRSQCPACNEYFQALEADDRLLREFAESVQPNLTRLENITIDELRRRQLRGAFRGVSTGRRILYKRASQIAATILIFSAILIVAVILVISPDKTAEIVDQSDEPAIVSTEPPIQVEKDLDAITEAESLELRQLILASDISGVLAMLNDGQPQTKIAAASYLAENGDERAIGALAQLAAEWQGEAARNPFAAAIARIMIRIQEQEQKSEPDDDDEFAVTDETAIVNQEHHIDCKGVVVDEQGSPIADAKVLLYHNRNRWGLGNRVIEEATSAVDGSFAFGRRIEFSSIKQLSYAEKAYMLMPMRPEYVLVAVHPDYAFGWRNIRHESNQDTYQIVLTKPIYRGIVVTDREGKPLPGVRIWPHHVGDSRSPRVVFRDELFLATDVGFIGGTTDVEGQVAIRNLPNTYCSFQAAIKGYAKAVFSPTQRITRIHLTRGASVSGWVLSEEDKPVVGATVSFSPNEMYDYFLTLTDSEGFFRFEDLPAKGWNSTPMKDTQGASGLYTVTIKHEQHAAQQTDVTLLPGQTINDFLVRAYSDTTLIECRVVEFGTDVPVSGASIHGWNRIGKFSGYSDAGGVFMVRVLPGPVQISFHSPPKGVYVLDERTPDESSLGFDATGEKMIVTLKTPPIAGFLRSVSGIVLGPDGTSQINSETFVYAGSEGIKTSIASRTERPVRVDGDGRFELRDVPAGRRLHLYVATKDHTLAATGVFDIPDDPDWSDYLVINLEATQSASVVVNDENGNIVNNVEFRIDPIVDGERITDVNIHGSTNENGLLELDGILPGMEYYLRGITSKNNEESSLETTNETLTIKMVLMPLQPY